MEKNWMNHNVVISYIADKVNCTSDYSIWFAAFDLEENQPSCSAQVNCPCAGILCGSSYFVQNFSRYLNSTGANFQGAFILETILNHNTTQIHKIFLVVYSLLFHSYTRQSQTILSEETSWLWLVVLMMLSLLVPWQVRSKEMVRPRPRRGPFPITPCFVACACVADVI